jgi:hypothetical protein
MKFEDPSQISNMFDPDVIQMLCKKEFLLVDEKNITFRMISGTSSSVSLPL